MKFPKTTKRYCVKCKKHTEHSIAQAKKKERSTLSKGSIQRARKRGLGRGFGNLGKYGSKPAISRWKRAGAKASKKQDLRFKCKVCGKISVQRAGFRAKRLEFK